LAVDLDRYEGRRSSLLDLIIVVAALLLLSVPTGWIARASSHAQAVPHAESNTPQR